MKSQKFRTWLFEDEDSESRVDALIDQSGYILFFKKGKDIFACSEDGRVVFAKIKNPDDETPAGWEDEASFSADNLNKKIRGEPGQHVFDKASLKDIKIIDRDEAVKILKKEAQKPGAKMPEPKVKIFDISHLLRQHIQKDPDDAPNFVRADEE